MKLYFTLLAIGIYLILTALYISTRPETPQEAFYYTEKVTIADMGKRPSKGSTKRPIDQDDTEVTLYATTIQRLYGKHLTRDEAVRVVRLTHKYSKEFGVDPTLMLGLIGAESSYNKKARSHVGALGYTQVWPKWHQDKIKGRDILDTSVNIEVGTRYLKDCLNRFGSEYKALACYNGALHRNGQVMKVAADSYYSMVKQNQERITKQFRLASL